MELLKKRDIKKYRKEMRKIKKDLKDKRREELGIEKVEQPKPIRAPEEIKELKQAKFDKIKNKMAMTDFTNAVQDDKSAVTYINKALRKIDSNLTVEMDDVSITKGVVQTVKSQLKLLDADVKQGTKRNNVPQIMVLTADTNKAIDIIKEL